MTEILTRIDQLEKENEDLRETNEHFKKLLHIRPFMLKLDKELLHSHFRLISLIDNLTGITCPPDNQEDIRKEIINQIDNVIFCSCKQDILLCANLTDANINEVIKNWKEGNPSVKWKKFTLKDLYGTK